MPQRSLYRISLKIVLLKLLPHLTDANEIEGKYVRDNQQFRFANTRNTLSNGTRLRYGASFGYTG